MADILLGLQRRKFSFLASVAILFSLVLVLIFNHQFIPIGDINSLHAFFENINLASQMLLLFFFAVFFVFFQLIIGVSSFGFFSSIAIASSLIFTQSSLLEILLLYLVLVVLGAFFKLFVFEKMFLPNSVELALIIAIVAIFFYAASSFYLDLNFDIINLVVGIHLIERFSRTLEEYKLNHAIKLFIGTIITAFLMFLAGTFFVINLQEMIWISFFIAIFAAISMGTYTGMRFTEFFRFSSFRKK